MAEHPKTRSGLAASRLLLLIGLVWLVLLCYSVGPAKRAEEPFIVAFFMLYGLHVVVKVLLAAEATRQMNEDRASGALELLLVTPLPIRVILRGQYEGLRSQFRGPVRTLLIMNLGMIACVLLFHKKLSMGARDQGIFVEVFAGGILVLLADFKALRWTGISAGLISTRHYRAVLATLGKIMGPPWVYIFLMVFIGRHFNSSGEAAFMIGLYILLSLILAAAMALTSKRRLEAGFRELASEPLPK